MSEKKFDPSSILKPKFSSSSRAAGIPTGTKLTFYSKTKNKTEKTAEATWNVKQNSWVFSGKDGSLVSWLEGIFSQPIIGKAAATHPNMTIKQDSMAYVYYMRDILMPRKNVIMKIED